ncbi:NAD(P)H-dependent oxidoreductase subunit E [Aminithiophilus ramosus]|uniref:NAD(P)H-dependent oxidoreductase subunit E n=2 Tax=Synergistales TaxID=649776 RepID=A0A9Q7EYU7_9BACT|nr:NAD(P)H-dependent oxidoreductase subunit E [Aminithiophilus ramosus]QTX32411.1 NAD(P)H-dependent oxidoreductase subunit E [Aminithiophilus ramosus]QVL36288.1 NAD(P)H-dependent oxidoreductase subunit E [Synergistota bacterium]
MTTCCKTHPGYEELAAFIEGLPDKKGELITVLHRAQGIFGCLPREIQEYVAEKMELPLAKVYGVVKFYSFFHMLPRGKHPISVCMGTACYVRGAEDVVEELAKQLKIKVGGVTEDGKFSLDTLRCVGACGLAPVVIVGEKVYGRVSPSQISAILAEYAEA